VPEGASTREAFPRGRIDHVQVDLRILVSAPLAQDGGDPRGQLIAFENFDPELASDGHRPDRESDLERAVRHPDPLE
jgi:hypothetical protein